MSNIIEEEVLEEESVDEEVNYIDHTFDVDLGREKRRVVHQTAQLIKFREHPRLAKRSQEKKEAVTRVDDILSEFSFTQNNEKAILSLESLYEEYPKNVRVLLTLSNYYFKRGEHSKAIKLIESAVIREYDKKTIDQTLSAVCKDEQFQLYFQLSEMKKHMYYLTKTNMKLLEESMSCLQQCSLFNPRKVICLENLAMIYDGLKIYVNSNRIWKSLIEQRPHEKRFYKGYIQSLKDSKQKEKLVEFLKECDEKKVNIDIVYHEYAELMKKKKKIRKELLKKRDFYAYVPTFCKKLIYNEYSYETYTTVKNRDQKAMDRIMLLFQTTSDTSSEFLIAILYNIIKEKNEKELDKKIVSEMVEIIMEQLQKRMKSKILKLLFKVFKFSYHEIFSGQIIILFMKNIAFVKKNEVLYKEYFDQLIELFIAKSDEIDVYKAFDFLKDSRAIPYLISALKFGSEELKKKSALVLSSFGETRKEEIVKLLRTVYGDVQNSSEMLRINCGCSLFKILKDGKYLTELTRVAKTKKKNLISNEVIEFLQPLEGISDFGFFELMMDLQRRVI